ncbi:hypothetical protein IMZ16_04160 [Cruoricaptor ignavus]|uniref:Uncharacterized protein n=1 Tax=Cruoricaptor ignavus TaxID=1118202 RepID=A0A7M1T4G0_9FLAO|nr:hypothetical protein [Cruoricaptor ignavus]QOR74635.1 hypothetical protein IMZ16_04160 [Cruoricaptor ignavus]
MNKVSEKLRKSILTDNALSAELAIRVGLKQSSVLAQARRNSSRLASYEAINFFKEKGYTEQEIFDNNKNILK